MTRDNWDLGRGSLIQRRRWILLAAFAGAVTAALYTLTRSSYFIANSSIVAGGRSQGIPSQFSGLAARLGVDFGGGDAASPAFAAGIMSSPPVMQELARSLGLELRVVEGRVRVLPVPSSGIIRIEGRGSTRAEAALVMRSWLSIADSMARNVRNQMATEEGNFLDSRLHQVREQLSATESQLERFHEENRVFVAPNLLIREARLQRAVQMHTAVYQQLSELYESARIEQFRDTPTFAVLGDVVIEEQDPGVAAAGLAGAILGALLVACALVVASFVRYHG